MTVLDLEVRPSNTAGLLFWEHFGFVPVGLLAAYYPDGEAGLQMRLRLSPGDGGEGMGAGEV